MNKLVSLCFIVNLTLCSWSSHAADTCRPSYVLGETTLTLPCVDWVDGGNRQVFQFQLSLQDINTLQFKLENQTPVTTPTTVGAMFRPASKNLYIPAIDVVSQSGVTIYEVTLQERAGIYTVVAAKTVAPTGNHRPEATSIAIQADKNAYFQQIQLTATDADGDKLTYELLAESKSKDYDLAFLDPESHILHVKLETNFTGVLEFVYRVTDGKQFSNIATAKITVDAPLDELLDLLDGIANQFGSLRIDAREFAGMRSLKNTASGRFGVGAPAVELPSFIDLSGMFPEPRSQGDQNSCVGWSVAYAVKSYQEILESNVSVTDNAAIPDNRLFSPSFLYNQLNGGKDSGLRISDALDFVVKNGLATLATMPYYESDYQTLPSAAAIAEALNYKAAGWATIKNMQQVKQELAKGLPVIIGIAAYKNFLNLKGTTATYNTSDNNYLGDHAVVIVGYDDNFQGGGAFKVINSYGKSWGDQGYFWLPYDFMSSPVKINGKETGLLAGAFVLFDVTNATPAAEVPQQPDSAKEDLPNFTVTDWQADYEPRVDGKGLLQYTVMNSGKSKINENQGTVSLVLATTTTLNPLYDTYYTVHRETIPFEIMPGQAVVRNATNSLTFAFPSVPSGDYYFYLMLDEFNYLNETDKLDNLSVAQKLIHLPSNLPDIATDFWYSEFDHTTGAGTLEYTIVNRGKTAVEVSDGWEIALKLMRTPPLPVTEFPDHSAAAIDKALGHIVLWRSAPITTALPPLAEGQDPTTQPAPFVVPQAQAIPFNLYTDVNGNKLPPGMYELVLTLDNSWKVTQSFYDNDISYSGKIIEVPDPNQPSVLPMPSTLLPTLQATETTGKVTRAGHRLDSAYNGRVLPRQPQGKIQVRTDAKGNREVEILPLTTPQNPLLTKTVRAQDKSLSPIAEIIYMPQATSPNGTP